MENYTENLPATIGLTWCTGFLLLFVAGIAGVLPDAGQSAWDGLAGRGLEAALAAMRYVVPLCCVALLSGVIHRTQVGQLSRGLLVLLLLALLMGPEVVADGALVLPGILIALSPWLAWGINKRRQSPMSTSTSIGLLALAVALVLGGAGITVTALLGLANGAPGYKLLAIEAQTSYFNFALGILLGLLTATVALACGVSFLGRLVARH